MNMTQLKGNLRLHKATYKAYKELARKTGDYKNANQAHDRMIRTYLQIRALRETDRKHRELRQAIDAINSISGRASVGHDKDCDCSYCVIHRIAYEVWRFK